MIEFFESCVPPKATAQQKRLNNGVYLDSPRMKDAKATFGQILAAHKPQTPLSGTLEVHVEVTWPWLSGEPKKNRLSGKKLHTSKPDLDNWVKMLIDEMVKWRFMENDQSIASLSIRKWWGDRPGVYVKLKEIEE